jgi:plasmid stabilization system protein ParE
MVIFLSESAESDIENLLLYYHQEAGRVLAEKIEKHLFEQLEGLTIFPESIRKSERVKGARELVFQRIPYIAYVRIHIEKEQIEVLNVVHTAKKFP